MYTSVEESPEVCMDSKNSPEAGYNTCEPGMRSVRVSPGHANVAMHTTMAIRNTMQHSTAAQFPFLEVVVVVVLVVTCGVPTVYTAAGGVPP